VTGFTALHAHGSSDYQGSSATLHSVSPAYCNCHVS